MTRHELLGRSLPVVTPMGDREVHGKCTCGQAVKSDTVEGLLKEIEHHAGDARRAAARQISDNVRKGKYDE